MMTIEDMFGDLQKIDILAEKSETKEVLMVLLIDTVGMNTLYLPDLQYHFHDVDPNWIVNHAYNVASYILENDNPIKSGETVDGIINGRMTRELQWKCQYEEALIQPMREVIDIHMGKYASGGR